jgi:hypothetical protein
MRQMPEATIATVRARTTQASRHDPHQGRALG